MNTFEYTPFTDIQIPYIAKPELAPAKQFKLFIETVIAYAQIPLIARFAIHQALKEL